MNFLFEKAAFGFRCLVLVLAVAGCYNSGDDPGSLENRMSVDKVLTHLQEFEEIARKNEGNRASGFNGYRDSIDYIRGTLSETGFSLTEQEFTFRLFWEMEEPVFSMIAPVPRDYVLNEQFATFTYSAAGDISGEIVFVDPMLPPGEEANSSTSGCEIEDFEGLDLKGKIAIIQRGGCAFFEKAQNAEACGAAAVIIFNEGQNGRTNMVKGLLSSVNGVSIPVIGVAYDVGLALYDEYQAGNTIILHIKVNSVNDESASSCNLIAESPWGDARNVVMLGSHVDSVPNGPGINDPASGVAALIQLARLMDRMEADGDFNPENKVRIAFWGAEEYGQIGSNHYLEDLSLNEPEAFRDIAMYLNFDMIASNNYSIGVLDADQSDTQPGYEITADGAESIESVFTNYFIGYHGIIPIPMPLNGTSDYDGFIRHGIPACGLFTGADGIKAEEEAQTFGGTAGTTYDPYSHTPRDTVENLNLTALQLNAKAMAHVAQYYAEKKTVSIPKTGRRSLSSRKYQNVRIPSAFIGKFDKYHKDRRMRDFE